jgi:hypothetical protein
VLSIKSHHPSTKGAHKFFTDDPDTWEELQVAGQRAVDAISTGTLKRVSRNMISLVHLCEEHNGYQFQQFFFMHVSSVGCVSFRTPKKCSRGYESSFERIDFLNVLESQFAPRPVRIREAHRYLYQKIGYISQSVTNSNSSSCRKRLRYERSLWTAEVRVCAALVTRVLRCEFGRRVNWISISDQKIYLLPNQATRLGFVSACTEVWPGCNQIRAYKCFRKWSVLMWKHDTVADDRFKKKFWDITGRCFRNWGDATKRYQATHF